MTRVADKIHRNKFLTWQPSKGQRLASSLRLHHSIALIAISCSVARTPTYIIRSPRLAPVSVVSRVKALSISSCAFVDDLHDLEAIVRRMFGCRTLQK